MQMAGGFLQYHEPGIVSILILISFFTFLWLSSKISGRLIHASIVGPIVTGIIYGPPLANILHSEWQDTFLYLGFIGLILIIFEGGLTARLDLLRANFTLSLVGAAIGVILPIAFSYLLCFLGFGYGAVETFILGAPFHYQPRHHLRRHGRCRRRCQPVSDQDRRRAGQRRRHR
ncbi:Na+/H+ exchanger family protein [Apiospora arundinis]